MAEKQTTRTLAEIETIRDNAEDIMAEMKAWVRRELHLHATGHSEDERIEKNP